MKCDICGKEEARQRHVSRSYGKGESLLVIEDVPTIQCPNCGEGYLTAQTLKEIERIKRIAGLLHQNVRCQLPFSSNLAKGTPCKHLINT